MTEKKADDIWRMATDAHCFMCDQKISLGGVIQIADESDIDELYDLLDCCDDPSYELLIISHEPLFNNEDADGDAKIQANPSLGIEADRYEYVIADDLFLALGIDY